MTTDVLDEHQRLKYQTTQEISRHSSTKPVLAATAMATNNPNQRRTKYPTQSSLPSARPASSSIHQRHSGGSDFFSILRSFALKPFRTASMSEAMAGGQTSNVISGATVPNQSPVNLLRYRPLSDMVIDRNSYAQSTEVSIDWLIYETYSIDRFHQIFISCRSFKTISDEFRVIFPSNQSKTSSD